MGLLKALKDLVRPRNVEELEEEAERLQAKVKVEELRKEIRDLKQPKDSKGKSKGASMFQNFADELSKTKFAKQGIGGDLPNQNQLKKRKITKKKNNDIEWNVKL